MTSVEMFPYRLRYLRKCHKMSQTELAKAIGVDQYSVSRYETGKARPSMETLTKIAAVFEVSLDWLCCVTG